MRTFAGLSGAKTSLDLVRVLNRRRVMAGPKGGRKIANFWAGRRVFAALAANRNPDNDEQVRHAVFPSKRALERSRPIRGNSFLSSGPCSKPVNASLRG